MVYHRTVLKFWENKIILAGTKNATFAWSFTGKFSSPFYFRSFRPYCQHANLRLGEFQCFKPYLSGDTVSGQIQYRVKLFASVEGRK